MNFLRSAVTCDLHGESNSSNCEGALVGDRNGLGLSGKAINHRENLLRRRTERERALPYNDIDVERCELQVSLHMFERRARRRVCKSVTIADLTILYERGDVATNARPSEMLRYSPHGVFVTVMRRRVERTHHFNS